MLSNAQSATIAQKSLAIQIISAGILIGAVLFAVVIGFLVNWNEVTDDVPIMTLFGAGTGFSLFCLAFVVPRVMSASSAQATAHQLVKENREVEEDQTLLELVHQLTVNQLLFSAFKSLLHGFAVLTYLF